MILSSIYSIEKNNLDYIHTSRTAALARSEKVKKREFSYLNIVCVPRLLYQFLSQECGFVEKTLVR